MEIMELLPLKVNPLTLDHVLVEILRSNRRRLIKNSIPYRDMMDANRT